MTKRRSKKQKKKAAQKRQKYSYQVSDLKTKQTTSDKVVAAKPTKTTNKTKEISKTVQDRLLGYDLKLINQDLFKTVGITFVIMIILAALKIWL